MTISKFKVQFGPVSVLLESDQEHSDVLAVLHRWLNIGVNDTEDRLNHDVRIVLSRDEMMHDESDNLCFCTGPSTLISNKLHYWDGKCWELAFDIGVSPIRDVHCQLLENKNIQLLSKIPDTLLRLIHQHFFGITEIRASAFLYRALLPIVQLHLLEKGASLIHASSLINCQDAAMSCVIMGWAGCGKTNSSSSLYLRENSDWAPLSDDLAIIDENGSVWLSPIPVNIFPYNVRNFPQLSQFLENDMGILNRLHWILFSRIFGPSSVARRRALPLLDGKIQKNSPHLVSKFIYLQRCGNKTLSISQSICRKTIAQSMANILLFELKDSIPLFTSANSISHSNKVMMPDIEGLTNSIAKIYNKAIKKSPVFIVFASKDASPQQLGEFIESSF